jgi:lipopolysaccharide export system permease protein
MRIPILWRYAIISYLKIFFLSVAAFVSILLVSRFKEMARFAALSSDWLKTGLFTVYQVPFILPMAIPLSALIASLLLFQRLSRSYELTAFRASGLSLKKIMTPLCITSAFLSLLNFCVSSELAPYCRRESKALLYRETSVNPLLLLQRQQLIKIKDAYLQLDVEEEGRLARDFILIAHNESNQRLSLLSAKKLRVNDDELLGNHVAIVSHLHSDHNEAFDPLIIENQASMSTAAPVLSAALKKNRPKIETGALGLRLLKIRLGEKGRIAKAARVEILRRISVTLAVFSFTLLGCTFGIELTRTPSRRGLLYALLLTLTVLMSYLLGKELKFDPLFATLAFLLPHLLIWLSCLHRQSRIDRGLV